MSGTLYSLDLLQTGAGFIMAGLIGVLFGFFLEKAGFGSSRKLTGIFYLKDMAVLKVMFTAVVVALIGYHFLESFGLLAPNQIYILDTYWGAQIVGGLIFGVGFVVGGWCPGTAFVGLASFKLDALVFIGGTILGSILFAEAFPVIQPLYDGMHREALYLTSSFGLSAKVLTFAFCVIAVVAFALSTRIETWIGGKPRAGIKTRSKNWIAGFVLIALGAFVFILPQPKAAPLLPRGAGAGEVKMSLLTEVVRELDHIEPHELADILMAGEKKLLVIDIRPGDAYEKFHLRGAVNIPLEVLAKGAASRLPKDGLIVLYSNGTTHAAQAWMELRRIGFSNVRVLTDGLAGFWRDCLSPPSLSGPIDEHSAKSLFSIFEKRRAFFLALH